MKVWDNAGSKSSHDLALWRGVSSSEDIVGGGIFSVNPGHAYLTAEQTAGIVAIHKTLLVEDDTTQMWNDAGTGAAEDLEDYRTYGTLAGDVDRGARS